MLDSIGVGKQPIVLNHNGGLMMLAQPPLITTSVLWIILITWSPACGRTYCESRIPYTRQSWHSPVSCSTGTFGSVTRRDILVQSILQYVPFTLLSYIPNPKMKHLRYAGRVLTNVAKSLIEEKTKAMAQGKNSRDIMSILGKNIPGLTAMSN